MSRRQPRGEATRQRIMETALREFASRGYANVTVEEIAANAGVTKGAVYYGFKDGLHESLRHVEPATRLSAR